MDPEEKDTAAENLPQSQDETRKPPAKGAEQLRRAADMVLEDKSLDIAFALVESCLKGHIQSARFLYLLADGQQKLEAAQVVEALNSLAIELTQQPEWSETAQADSAPPPGDAPQPKG